MRLDEWQKFIESQFLEEAAPGPVPTKPAVVSPPKQQTQLALDDDLVSPQEASNAGEPHPSLPADTNVPSRETESALPTEFAESENRTAHTTPRQTGFVVRSVVEEPAEAPTPLPAVSPVPHKDAIDLDLDIPVFADYLPSKAPLPATPQPAVAAPFRAEDGASGPISVLVPLTSGFVSVNTVPIRPDGADGEAVAPNLRRKRAPQARNVQPETAPTGLTTTDLWSQVPRHVQTLLALERREEEREVAQSSYKRPFQEKRAELIARILDPVLSLEDTARLLNVCPTTVRRYTNKGILTHYRKEPDRPTANTTERETRQRRFRLSDILTFLETQQSALEADRLQERVAPSRRKRTTTSLDPSDQD